MGNRVCAQGLQGLIDAYAGASGSKDPSNPHVALLDTVEQKQKQSNQSQLNLLMSQLEFDYEAFKVYRQKVIQCQMVRARKAQDWKGQMVEDAQKAAEAYMESHAAWMLNGN